MKLVDLNLLLYAVNRNAVQHERAKVWLERTLSGDESVALPWVVLLGFLRVATHPRVFPNPLSADQALATVDGWLAQPPVTVVHAGDEHWQILRDLLIASGTAGNLTTDAHLAALAIESGSELCSTDSDFARFRQVRWVNPLTAT